MRTLALVSILSCLTLASGCGKRAKLVRHRRLTPSQLENRFRAEQRDGAWSEGYEATARAALARAFPAERLEVACATSLCRIRAAHSSLEAQQLFVTRSWAAMPPNAGTAAHRDPGAGPLATTVYLARAGHEAALVSE